MIDRGRIRLERTVAASPLWLRVRDTFTGAAPKAPVRVRLERETAGGWLPFDHPHRLSPEGDIAFVNLGRTRDPALVGRVRIRVTVTVDGSVSVTRNGGDSIVVNLRPWSPDAPVRPRRPILIALHPGPAYPFPVGTPVLAGRVTHHGAPVERAAVEVRDGGAVVEAARTDAGGRFRLPLRWAAGPTVVHAKHGAASGQLAITVPADLSQTHEITTLP